MDFKLLFSPIRELKSYYLVHFILLYLFAIDRTSRGGNQRRKLFLFNYIEISIIKGATLLQYPTDYLIVYILYYISLL